MDNSVELNRLFVIYNKSRNPKSSFTIPIKLRVRDQQVHTEALVDSGATTNFINTQFAKNNHLAMYEVARPLTVINADGTTNKAGKITHYVIASISIGDHVTRHKLFCINIGDKNVMIGYTYLYEHNPSIDWSKGEWRFTRCPNSCTDKARKIKIDTPETNSTEEEYTFTAGLEEIGTACHNNSLITWVDPANENLEAQINLVERIRHTEDFEDEDTRLWKTRVPEWVHHFGNVFSKVRSERMPERKHYDHPIDFIEGKELPKPAKIYPLAPVEKDALKQWLQEELRKGYIRKSTSPIASPFFFVKKSDATLRPIMDYRKLKEITVKNRYPLPRINDLIDSLSGATYFTKIDLRWGYNNIRIKEGDEWKTAFITQYGLFEATVMYFGFCNAPATFQSMMNHLLYDLIQSRKVAVYMDDILIFNNDKDEHRCLVCEVLSILEKNDLFAKAEKCFFEKRSIEYLGMVISHNSVQMDPKKVAGVLEWPVPSKVKHVQAFLGFANFYRRFIEGFAHKA